MSDISDGKMNFSGYVEDISKGGFRVNNLPVKLVLKAREYRTVLAGYELSFKLICAPRWTRKSKVHGYQEAGFEILQSSDLWDEFIYSILSDRHAGHLDTQTLQTTETGDGKGKETVAKSPTNPAGSSLDSRKRKEAATDLDEFRISLFEGFQTLYLKREADPVEMVLFLNRIWQEAKAVCTPEQLAMLQEVVRHDVATMRNIKPVAR